MLKVQQGDLLREPLENSRGPNADLVYEKSQECQLAHWQVHKGTCSKPGEEIVAIEVLNEYERGEGGPFRTVHISPSHPVFSSAGEMCPIPTAIGIPLRVYRHPMEGHGNYNNAIAVWLRSEITDVLAPME